MQILLIHSIIKAEENNFNIKINSLYNKSLKKGIHSNYIAFLHGLKQL